MGEDFKKKNGLTLVELLIAVAIMSLIAGVMTYSLGNSLESWDRMKSQSEFLMMGRLALNRMVGSVRNTNLVLIPLQSAPSRDVLAIAAMNDNDGDGRIDEDPSSDMTGDNTPGISGIDDDGDGLIDEGDNRDDDEDGLVNEDPLDGIDNDGDGNIDEDTGDDRNNDGLPGIAGFDDDQDGDIDEGGVSNDDEDFKAGMTIVPLINEDAIEPIVFRFENGKLIERRPDQSTPLNFADYNEAVLAEHVKIFRVERLTGSKDETIIKIQLVLDDGSGNQVSIETQGAPRNLP